MLAHVMRQVQISNLYYNTHSIQTPQKNGRNNAAFHSKSDYAIFLFDISGFL